MSKNAGQWLVDTEWLDTKLGEPGLVVLDASWHMPNSGRDPYAEYLQEHIPGAQFFDIDKIADPDTDLPHMLPDPQIFAEAVQAMGVGPDSRVVVYDCHGIMSAPRVWWTFRAMGFDNVAVLNGGLFKWKLEGRSLEEGAETSAASQSIDASLIKELVSDSAAILRAIDTQQAQILDARPRGRFLGDDPEPRPGLTSGHMPSALSLPFPELIRDSGIFKDSVELKAAFDAAGIDMDKPVIATCGSGITASVLALGLALLGHEDSSVYDGSWAEWGANEDLPIAKGDGE